MRPHSLVLPAALLSLLAACPRRVAPAADALAESTVRAPAADAPGRTLALAGLRAWWVDGDAARATALSAQALERAPGEPWAHYLELQLQRRAGQPARMVEAALRLLERSPAHPLAAVAARTLSEAAGSSAALDASWLPRAEALLSGGALHGDAAGLLRSAVATAAAARGDTARKDAALAALGAPAEGTLLGPLAAWSLLDVDGPTQPERDGALPESLAAPAGTVVPRVLPLSLGRLSLQPEPARGDVYLLAFDVEVKEAGTFVLRTHSASALWAWLDGTPLLARRTFERVLPLTDAAAVQLEAGTHRLLLKWTKDGRAGEVGLSFSREGAGQAPTFRPARGPAPRWAGGLVTVESPSLFPSAAALDEVLSAEVGPRLSALVAARDALRRDADGLKPLLLRLGEGEPSPALLALRAEAQLQDRSLPTRVAHGRAARDLDAALSRDGGDVAALLLRAQLALDDGRLPEAASLVSRARTAAPAPSPAVALFDARVNAALGLDGLADERAAEAAGLPGAPCDALALRLDLAQRRGAAAVQETLLRQLSGCAAEPGRRVEWLRARGDLAGAVALQETVVAAAGADPAPSLQLASLHVAARDWDRAEAVLKGVTARWPRSAPAFKKLGDVYELAGRQDAALAARDEALLRDGADLSLRRMVHRQRTGKELLDDLAVGTEEALARYEMRPTDEDSASVLVLDAAAVRVYPDGSQVDRIHIVNKALDSAGVAQVAEVTLPPGAQVLSLHTLKADGTKLEPEHFEQKESISLPGVSAGDMVEYEYLLAHPARGPGMPGFTAPSFYFQLVGEPNAWSTYTVAAPRGTGMRVDARQVTVEPPFVRGEEELFHHEAERVEPWRAEPDGPSSPNEFLPVVTLGAGAEGQSSLAASFADATLDRAQRTFEVEAFARAAAAGKTGDAAVRAVYAAVMERIAGRDAGLGQTAAATLAEGRGSRTLLLKAALTALGMDARVVAVRTSGVDAGPVRFPSEALMPYACVRVTLPDGSFRWLDGMVRFAPYGELPEQATSREAWVLPEPGKAVEATRTPAPSPLVPKQVRLTLELSPEGTLRGEGAETLAGFEAAQFSEQLEAIPPDQRKQALEQALSRYFGGAELSEVILDAPRAVGATLVLKYRFQAPGFARREGNALVLGPLTFPTQLSRRYVQVRTRKTPLVLDSSEGVALEATLQLPEGATLSDPLAGLKVDGPLGTFEHGERQQGRTVTVRESLQLRLGRVPPGAYEDFARFAGQVDLVQARDLVVRLP
ncbi:MAG: hypothetical protein RL653_860 [Pseudomonadota bacterium]|jgi:tetratricopeptide (TPR) repeat protein